MFVRERIVSEYVRKKRREARVMNWGLILVGFVAGGITLLCRMP